MEFRILESRQARQAPGKFKIGLIGGRIIVRGGHK